MRLPDLEGWAVFARVAELGSFAAASSDLGLSTATVSKVVARLERRVGATLLSRTSRRVALTALGRELASVAGRLLAETETMERTAASQASRPRGTVRIAAPMGFGVGHLAPLIPEFLALHPNINLEVSFSDEVVDLIGGGFDFALRLAVLDASSLRVRRICEMRLLLVAAPQWIERCGVPASPDDIPAGEMFGYLYARTPNRVVLRHRTSGAEATVATSGRLRANNGQAMVPALTSGAGVGLLPEFIVCDELRQGRLVPLLAEWRPPEPALNLVLPPGGPRPLRVTTAIDFLTARLAAAPWAVQAAPFA